MRVYRLRVETLALRQQAARSIAITLPSGAILRVPSAEGDGLVSAEWNGEGVRLFAADLRDRGEIVEMFSSGQ